MSDRSLAQIHAEMMKHRVQSISARLRDLADEVDRHAQNIDKVPAPGSATYGTIASRVAHTVLWGVANLHMDGLATDATDADIARTKGE